MPSNFEDLFGEIEDAGRSHSRFAPSSLKRIISCPRSVALSEAMAGTAGSGASVYAAEGTVAHSVGEAHLRSTGPLPHETVAIGSKHTVDGHAIVVDQDMHTHAVAYANYIRDLMVPGDTLYVEVTVRLDAIVGAAANMYGHCDAAVWSPSRRLLIVCDYKYGRGIKVSAIENEQLMAYALGALLSIPDLDPDDVAYIQTHVFQPRVPGQTPPGLYAAVDLLRWGHEELAPVIASIEKDGAAGSPLVTGNHCRFCPALHSCPAQRKRANDAVKRWFGKAPVMPVGLTEQEIADGLAEARVVRAYLDAVEEEAYRRVLSGKHIPDNKLVETRGRRVWKDEKAVGPALIPLGLAMKDLYEPAKMKSVAQVEKTFASSEFRDQMKDLYETKSSGTTLVPLSDPRPPVRVSKAQFPKVEE